VDEPLLPPRSDAVELVLNRHATRRAAGLPTVTVLAGPVGAAIAAFRAWANRRGHPVRVGSDSNLRGVATLFAQAAVGNRDLAADAYSYLASHTGRPVPELRAEIAGMTRHDLDQFFAANDARLPPGDGVQTARRVCEATLTGEASGVEWIMAGAAPLAVLSGLAALVPADGAPACLLTPPASGGVREWFDAAGAAGAAVAACVPNFPTAVVIPPAEWSRYLAEAPDNRVKALLQEGAVELPVLGEREVTELLSRSGTGRVPPTVLPVIADGVPAPFAAALASAVAAPVAAATADEDEDARSAAERFLYEFLELLPATAGRFELNADAGFRFGPRAAEVDLLARDLRIAVEIDGYYHFRDASNYRRDRLKDWELQRRGFLVLRFLADDIIPRLEEVRDRILAAIALRSAGPAV
jgi:hypothetical protein